ncbi:MAG: aldo/keto reductase [Candidatus Magasanikbacteria bacterium]
MNYITLNNGQKMPVLGLGTWKSPKDKVGEAIKYAILECGYRHIDCASIYGNEKEIGVAFQEIFSSGKVKREEVFITSKLWNDFHGKDDVELACKKTLSDLQLEYLDLYLVHWGVASPNQSGSEPVDENGVLITAPVSIQETWQAMEKLVSDGLVKAVGVANFTGPMLVDLMTYATIIPAVNQIELHPYNQQIKLVEFCKYKNIVVTAYSPLGSPANNKRQEDPPRLLDDEKINDLAKKYNKTPAQILIRWAIQRDTIAIPKSVNSDNIKNNINVFDFNLSVDEMSELVKLDKRYRFVNPYEWWRIPYFD